MLRFFIIAGEPSGDNIGAGLINFLKKQDDCVFSGIGGNNMTNAGLKSIFPMRDISLMGFSEIVPHIFKLSRRILQTIRAIKEFNPDAIITIDSPGFCFRVTRKLQYLRPSIKFIHYVAPTVWAYKPKRAKKIAKLYDLLLAILPFEPKYFPDIKTVFIGHPLISNKIGNAAAFNKEKQFLLLLSPGSRITEINTLMPIFIEAINRVNCLKNIQIVLITFSHLQKKIESYIRQTPFNIKIITDNKIKKNAMAAADLALSKCGTITNEIALHKTPVIATYKISRISAFIVKLTLKIRYFSIVNILANKMIIPELVQDNCRVDNIATLLNYLLKNKQARDFQVEEASKYIKQLNNPINMDPNQQAAQEITSLLNKNNYIIADT